jgi:hypothetical protein
MGRPLCGSLVEIEVVVQEAGTVARARRAAKKLAGPMGSMVSRMA